MMIKRIGVIGAGQMGSGIAHVCALKGFDIRLMDVDQPHINSGVENIGRNMDRQIGRGMIRPEEKDAALRRIETSTDFKAFADCDLVVEAATENESVKRDIFKRLCDGLPSNVLLATNTSSISVTRLASVTEASRVTEIDEVLVASSTLGGRPSQTFLKISRLIASFSVAASTTRSQSANCL